MKKNMYRDIVHMHGFTCFNGSKSWRFQFFSILTIYEYLYENLYEYFYEHILHMLVHFSTARFEMKNWQLQGRHQGAEVRTDSADRPKDPKSSLAPPRAMAAKVAQVLVRILGRASLAGTAHGTAR